MLTTHWPDKTK